MRVWAVKFVLAILIYGCLFFSLPSLEAWTTFWPESLKSPQVQFLLPIIFSLIPLVIDFSTKLITGFRIEKDGRIVFRFDNGKEEEMTREALKREIVAPLTEQILSLKKEFDDRRSRSTLTYTENQQKEAELRREIDRAKKEKEQLEALLDKLLEKLDGKDLSTTDHLYQKALTLFLHGQLDKALATLNDRKIQEKENAGADKQQLADLYLLKAEFLKAKLMYAEAGKCLEKAAEFVPDWEHCHDAARFYSNHNFFQKAMAWYEKSLAIAKKPLERAGTQNNFAMLQKEMQKYEAARNGFQEALSILCELAKNSSEGFLPDVARTLNNLANLQAYLYEYENAKNCFEKALEVARKLLRNDSEKDKSLLAQILNDFASLLHNCQEYEIAKEYYDEALRIRRYLSTSNPMIFRRYLAYTLNNISLLQKDLHEYEVSRMGYEEALGIFRDLSKYDYSVYQPYVADTLNNLASLYENLHDNVQSKKCFEEALNIWKKFAITEEEVYLPKVVDVLNNLGLFYFRLHK
jgi:tetratricopeptide (TPR) repeat protein